MARGFGARLLRSSYLLRISRFPTSLFRRSLLYAGAFVLAALLTSACRELATALGGTPGDAADRAGELLGALASRFGPLEREAAFDRARPRLARGALVPSRVYDDPEVWTRVAGREREIELVGMRSRDRYRIAVAPAPGPPIRPAEYRGRIGLLSAGGSDYEWTTRDELAAGRMSAAAVIRVLSVCLRAAERAKPDARAEWRGALPHAAAALGRLWSLETLAVAHDADGSARVDLVARQDAAGLEPHFPRYASFIRRYAVPLRFALDVEDERGARFLEVRFQESRLRLCLRTREGTLVPLAGGRSELPERLRARGEFSTRAGLFRIGLRDLESEVTLVREPDRQGFRARFRREPDWVLPPLVEPLFKAPLRYPFAGEGASFDLVVQGDGSRPTLFVSDSLFRVRESWIVRWLSSFTSVAVSDFRGGAEDESDRFAYEAILGLRADVVALLNGAR